MIQGSINQMLSSVEASMLAYKALSKKPSVEESSIKDVPQMVGQTKPDMSKQFEKKALDNVTSKANYEQQRATRVLNGMTMAQKHAYALTRKAREEENNNG